MEFYAKSCFLINLSFLYVDFFSNYAKFCLGDLNLESEYCSIEWWNSLTCNLSSHLLLSQKTFLYQTYIFPS